MDWMGSGNRSNLSIVYLIEDFPRDDKSRSNWSGMSALWMLTSELSEEWERCGAPLDGGPEESLELTLEPEFFEKLKQSSQNGAERLLGKMLATATQGMSSNATHSHVQRTILSRGLRRTPIRDRSIPSRKPRTRNPVPNHSRHSQGASGALRPRSGRSGAVLGSNYRPREGCGRIVQDSAYDD